MVRVRVRGRGRGRVRVRVRVWVRVRVRPTLRPPQVRLVRELAGAALSGTSVCQQMLMGEGKTTVILARV